MRFPACRPRCRADLSVADRGSRWCRFSFLSLVAAFLLLVAFGFRIATRVDLWQWWVPLAFVGGIAVADVASGLIHWGADTWGRDDLPIIGHRLLVPFRIHHMNPDDFLRRRFVDTNGDVAFLTAPVLFGLLAVPFETAVPALLLVADFTQYWVHRTFHVTPFLWPFHAIHHSIEEMDWLAGSRLHLLDVIVTRGLTYVPIFVLGFSQQALMVYVFLVAAQATFIHANVRWEFRPVRALIATPAFHHWHHSAEREAVDKNFAVHTPFWDILFRTYDLPDRWPTAYGLCGRRDVPARWLTQLIYPFRRRERTEPPR